MWDFPTTASPHHHITASPCEIFPITLEWIWLVNATQHSSDWLIVPPQPIRSLAFDNLINIKSMWDSLPPHHHITASPHHCITTSLHHHVTASLHHHITVWDFPTTVSQCEISLPLCHHITTSPHHHVRFSPPHWHESDWLILPSTVLIG